MSKLGKVTGFKRYLHLASCFGASIVIVGALFKIQHWPGANAALIAGLGTEAVLFCLFGIGINSNVNANSDALSKINRHQAQPNDTPSQPPVF